MPSKIRVLDEHTINKIAAGEVIENPSSVVKELVENSLDAGATDICVEIKGGGRQLIRITDNGCGMSNDDAILCLERHATSKIRAVEDIHELMTMGFRGEAVPSIAAISKFSIITRQRETESTDGTMVLVEGGKILKCCPVACSPGTTIEVKSLFFNIPVRKKFQKSPAYDANEILKVMTLLALGYPHIKFRLVNDQETVLSAPAPQTTTFLEQLKERIGSVLGGDYIESCIPIEGTKDEYQVRGWIGLPHHHRQNRTGQHLFINQRGIQSALVGFAVKDGYGTTLPAQRHPLYVIHLNMSGSLVDVNVHPQKREVRLRQEIVLREMVMDAVREAIQKNGVSATNDTFPRSFEPLPSPSFTPARPFPTINPVFNPQPTAEYKPLETAQRPYNPPVQHQPVELPLPPPKPTRTVPRVIAALPGFLILDGPPADAPGNKKGLCLVDQRAAHTRIIYEQLQKHRSMQSMEVQQLLIPHTIELTPSEAQTLKQHLEPLATLGIHLQEFGKHTFLLDSIPVVMGNIDPGAFVQEIVSHLSETDNNQKLHEHMDRRISQSAVRASISKDQRLSSHEGQTLMQQLFHCDVPWFCPQGKPTVVTISPEEIHKYFS